ncbi:hypothetical protein CEXT_209831 [Caerostris extrusa]|uniref:Uncharacterized protein n=1 Tax=Caerostris extrusa TaxID=172846 RepID=A0AAV4WK09_CAEEX|nr:hypothetical protein CEXT_209831 [Caerostris extrusa]
MSRKPNSGAHGLHLHDGVGQCSSTSTVGDISAKLEYNNSWANAGFHSLPESASHNLCERLLLVLIPHGHLQLQWNRILYWQLINFYNESHFSLNYYDGRHRNPRYIVLDMLSFKTEEYCC